MRISNLLKLFFNKFFKKFDEFVHFCYTKILSLVTLLFRHIFLSCQRILLMFTTRITYEKGSFIIYLFNAESKENSSFFHYKIFFLKSIIKC